MQTICNTSKNDLLNRLKKEAREAPHESGCYIMRAEDGDIIYVGKAKSLRNRLASYFSGKKDIKTATLMRHIASIETIIVSSEYEALLLENTLIKQHRPKYNIDLKDGKSYPSIRITADAFPRIFKTRQIIEDGSLYFGPFTNVQPVENLLKVLKKIYPIRKCKILRKRDNPCMYFHINQCAAPCCQKISVQEYAVHIQKITAFLEGNTSALIMELTEKMHAFAHALSFENAARFRDALRAVDEVSAVNAVLDFDTDGRDYIAFAAEGVLATWTVFSMRTGKLTGRDLYRTKSAADDHESLETFCMSYYTTERPPPQKIYIFAHKIAENAAGNTEVHDSVFNMEHLQRYFQQQFGFVPCIETPHEKRHLAVLAMARQNALEDLRKRLKERGAGPVLDELRAALNLRRRPERIEGFDIAQLNGKHPVASLISFYNGMMDKKNYRHFKLKTVIGKVDDFAAMREAVYRRYTRLLREQRPLPDFILIDGGIGQVNAAKGVLDELGIDCDIAGLAKRDEEIWLPAPPGKTATPVKLPKTSEALKLLQAVRDETHRFATALNQKLRSQDILMDSLEDIDGIGPKRARALLTRFGSLQGIAGAELPQLAACAGIPLEKAKLVRAAIRLVQEEEQSLK